MSTSTKHPGPPQPPDFLTIEEAARIARIGRTTAYDIAREYETTAGASGLPVVRFGKQLRVPRFRLETWLGGPITWPIADHEPTVAFAVASITPAPSLKRSSRRPGRPNKTPCRSLRDRHDPDPDLANLRVFNNRRVHSDASVWRCVVTVRVTTLKGTEAGAYYVERLPNYYLDSGEPRGIWFGEGTGQLGLAGDVEDHAFLAVMAGMDPWAARS